MDGFHLTGNGQVSSTVTLQKVFNYQLNFYISTVGRIEAQHAVIML